MVDPVGLEPTLFLLAGEMPSQLGDGPLVSDEGIEPPLPKELVSKTSAAAWLRQSDIKFGIGNRTQTCTSFTSAGFKSAASVSSAIPILVGRLRFALR